MSTKILGVNRKVLSMESHNGRPTGGKCVEKDCNCFATPSNGGVRVSIFGQENGVWVCSNHRGSRNLKGYSDENNMWLGSTTKDNISFSMEVESMGYSTNARAWFNFNHFIATSDCTVSIEYKSPIYRNFSSPTKIFGGIERLNEGEYDFSVSNSNCGLHTHFGLCEGGFNHISLRNDYEGLFGELDRYVRSLSCETREKFFGRDFGTWAQPCNFAYPTEHENWINIQHEYSLEFRLPHFVNAVQYIDCAKTLREVYKALKVHYIEGGNVTKASRAMVKAMRKGIEG